MNSKLKYSLFFACLIWLNPIYAKNSQPVVANSMNLQIELLDQQKAPERIVQIIDVASGKKAQANLSLNSTGTGYSGQFIIQFLKGDDQKRTYQFTDGMGQPYFAFSFAATGSNKILISSQKERLLKGVKDEESAKVISLSPVPITNPDYSKITSRKNQPVSAESLKKLKTESENKIKLSEKSQMQIELSEAQKRAEQLALLEVLSLEEKRKKAKEAEKFIQLADKSFFLGQYQKAFRLYAKAVELAPQQESYFYRYAVSAYKIGQYEKSLALLNLADVPLSQSTEKTYYQALNRVKLNDNDKALKDFLEVVEEKDPKLSPISSYLAGVLQYQSKKFSAARNSMQIVLDTSDDPKLDQSADEMMDLIDRMEQFAESQKEKYRLSFYLGLSYDENVLNLSTVNSSTDASALRLSYGASVLGYLHKTINSDLGLQLSISDIYSVDTGFQVTGTLQATDPLEYSLSAPYSLNFELNKQSYFLNLSPVYKSLAMNVDGDGRAEILTTSGINLSVSKIIKSNLTAALNLEILSEDSKLDISSDDDDQSGQKLTYGFQTTYLLDSKGEKSVGFELNQLNSNSKGDNYYYDKLSSAVTYITPLQSRWTGSFRLDYAQQNYSKLTSSRLDQLFTLGLSAAKSIKKNQSLNLGINYSTSSSNVESYDYSKWQITSLWTYQFSKSAK